MKIKAIFLPDIAFDNAESLIFEYDNNKGYFYLPKDNLIRYDLECILEDSNWLVFKTEIIEESYESSEEQIKYGITNLISKNELIETISSL